MEIEIVKIGLLAAPAGYWLMTPCERSSMCNGCGPFGNVFFDFLSILIPDALLGLDIREACNIHDYCRGIGMDFKSGDNLFMDNMSALIDAAGGPLRSARHVLAFHYWLAVRAWRVK